MFRNTVDSAATWECECGDVQAWDLLSVKRAVKLRKLGARHISISAVVCGHNGRPGRLHRRTANFHRKRGTREGRQHPRLEI